MLRGNKILIKKAVINGDKTRKEVGFIQAVYVKRFTEILSWKFKDGRDRLLNFPVS